MSREKQEKPSSMAATDTRGKKNFSSDPSSTPGLSLGWGPPHCQLQRHLPESGMVGRHLLPPLTPQTFGQGWGYQMPGSLPGPQARSQRSGSPRAGRAKGPDPPSPGRVVGIGVGKDKWGKARAPRLQNQVLWGGDQILGRVGWAGRGTRRFLWGSQTPCQPL